MSILSTDAKKNPINMKVVFYKLQDYIAAVVEYEPINATFPNETVEANLAQYVYFIEHAQVSTYNICTFCLLVQLSSTTKVINIVFSESFY